MFLRELTLSIILANYAAGFFSIMINFNLHYFFSFSTRTNYFKACTKYLLTFPIERTVNTIQLQLWIGVGLDVYLAKVVASAIQAPISYYLSKKFIFRVTNMKNLLFALKVKD
jgi:putative flippase GtrA